MQPKYVTAARMRELILECGVEPIRRPRGPRPAPEGRPFLEISDVPPPPLPQRRSEELVRCTYCSRIISAGVETCNGCGAPQ